MISDRNLHPALFRLQRGSYPVRDFIQYSPFGSVPIMRAKPETESIAHITGNDVQMSMKHFLPCGLAVREFDVYSFTLDPAPTQCRSNALRDAKHLRSLFLVQLCKVRRMPVGNHKSVPGIDRLMVQKSRAAIILINHADFKLA
jgi:hypothetical protein